MMILMRIDVMIPCL